MKAPKRKSESSKVSISLSELVHKWGLEQAAAKGFDTNFSAYIADLIRRDKESQSTRANPQ